MTEVRKLASEWPAMLPLGGEGMEGKKAAMNFCPTGRTPGSPNPPAFMEEALCCRKSCFKTQEEPQKARPYVSVI